MTSILGQIESEHPELFALEFEKIAESDFVYTLTSTNIDQSAPNLVKMYVTIRSRMSSIMDLIGQELFELSVLEFKKNAIFDFACTLAFANIDQSVPNLATIYIYIPIKSQMSSIMGQIESEHLELFSLQFRKIAESDFVYTQASINIDQSAPNLVKMYVTIRSLMSLIMVIIRPELSELPTLELKKNAIFDFVYTLAIANIDQSVPNLVTIYMPIKSRMSLIMGQTRTSGVIFP